MATDFQAKFLEFSQRKAACVAAGQTAPADDPDTAGSTNSTKVKKADVSVAPSSQKKSSPVAEDLGESVEVKPSEYHVSGSESQSELPATSLPVQVDGCCDSCSDDDGDDDDVEVFYSYENVTAQVISNYSVDAQYMEFMNTEEPELLEIWQSSIGLQVDGAADDETCDAKEDMEKSTSDSHMVTASEHQLSEAETSAAGANIEVSSTVAAVAETARSSASVVVDNSSLLDSEVASTCSASESIDVPVDTAKQLHLPTDAFVDHKLVENSVSEITMSQSQWLSDASVPESVSMPSTSELQPSTSSICNVSAETPVPSQHLQSDSFQTLECPVGASAPVSTTAATLTFATTLVSELQSSSASGAPLATAANFSAPHLEPLPLNPSVVGNGDVMMPSGHAVNQSLMTIEALPFSAVASTSSAVSVSVTSSNAVAVSVQQGVSSQCLTAATTLGSGHTTVSISSQVVDPHSVPTSALTLDPTSMLPAPGIGSAITCTAVAQTSQVDSGSSSAATNPAFTGAFQLRPEMQQFMGHAPRRIYMPPEFHMQHRMMQRGIPACDSMMVPPEQLPHGPPPPYPNRQFAGPQTFWVRQQHPSGMPPEWIRHHGDFVHRQLPPNVGSHEWSRPQMMPAEWSGRQRMQQEWVYFQQQPHQPAQAPHQWVRPPYSNMPGFQMGTAEVAPMQTDAYNSSYQSVPHNVPNPAAGAQDTQVVQGIKSPGSTTPRPPSHPSGSPVAASPASARADMTSPQSRSHTPRSMSRSSTPQAAVSGSTGMSRTPDQVALPTAAASPHPSAGTPLSMQSTILTSSPSEQSSGCQATDNIGALFSEMPRPDSGDLTSTSVSGSVSAAEPVTSHPSLAVVSGTHADSAAVPPAATPIVAFSHASGENMIYMQRPPHGMPMSSEMRHMGPPSGGRYIAPPSQSMYMPGHAGPGTSGMMFYRMPSSAASTHSAIGALLNQQRPPVGMSVHYPSANQPPPGATVVESRYQLIHTQDVYLPHSQRHGYSSAVTVAGPSVSGAGSFVLQHQRGPVPPLPADSAGHQEVANQAAMLPNSMQTLRGPFRMPQQLGPGSMPMGMRVTGSTPAMVYGSQRQPGPAAQVRMIAAGEMRPHMIHMPRSSVTEFPGPAYRPRPPGEQPLLLEDLLEQVCYLL